MGNRNTVPVGFDGAFEIRAVPDGRYLVVWLSSYTDAAEAEFSPPVREVVIGTIATVRGPAHEVTISNGSRITDIEFRVVLDPVPLVAPDTGAGETPSPTAPLAAAGAALMIAILGAGVLTLRARRAR